MAKTTLTVVLNRDEHDQPWGFRLRGGVDLTEPFILQKVSVCSPAEGELHRGDVLTNINGHDVANLTHQSAQELIKNAGNTISLIVNRAGSGQPGAPAPANAAPKPAPVSSNAANATRKVSTMSGNAVPRKISDIMASPVENLPVTVFPSSEAANLASAAEELFERDRERALVTHQPYRTTPLVLPGAKARRDSAGVTSQSYLRLQHNPLQWSSPAQPAVANPSIDALNNTLLKQKDVRVFQPEEGWKLHLDEEEVKEAAEHKASANDTEPKHQVVHKQFNSPMGLYSKENMEQTLKAQTGVEVADSASSMRFYDPRQSDTFMALQEAEINTLNRVHGQVRPPTQKAHVVNAAPFKVTKVNSLGVPEEKILQSYSFRRIMADVLGETDF